MYTMTIRYGLDGIWFDGGMWTDGVWFLLYMVLMVYGLVIRKRGWL